MNYTLYNPKDGQIAGTGFGGGVSHGDSIGDLVVYMGEVDKRFTHIIDGEPTFVAVDNTDQLILEAKFKRDRLLVECDWTQLPDVSEKTKAKYQTYRQALRDITEQDDFPYNVTWPDKPE